MKKMIAIAMTLLLTAPLAASAQTIAVSSADYSQMLTISPFVQFQVKVWMDTGGLNGNAAEFVVTELQIAYPGLLKTNTVKINNTALDLGTNSLGEYLMAFSGCIESPANKDLVTISYVDISGATTGAADVEISLRGFEPGDTRPSSFQGSPGFVDCLSNKVYLTVGGQDGGFTGSGATFADGHLMINPTPLLIPTENDSFGSLKARF